jgi:hypothetical protein
MFVLVKQALGLPEVLNRFVIFSKGLVNLASVTVI